MGTQLRQTFLIKPKWAAAPVFNERACNNRPWTWVLSQVLSTVCVEHAGIWTGVREMSEYFSWVTKVDYDGRVDGVLFKLLLAGIYMAVGGGNWTPALLTLSKVKQRFQKTLTAFHNEISRSKWSYVRKKVNIMAAGQSTSSGCYNRQDTIEAWFWHGIKKYLCIYTVAENKKNC